MPKYAVALQQIKGFSGGESTSLILDIVNAANIEEAVGKVMIAKKSPDCRLGAYKAMQVDDEKEKAGG